MEVKLPIRVGLMDDDFFALKWLADLLTRDVRTQVCFECDSPEGLLRELCRVPDVDVILLDPEYASGRLLVDRLINIISSFTSHPRVVCLAQYGEAQTLQAAIANGARGFLLKQDVRMGIGSALVMAAQTDFLVSPGLLPVLQQECRRLYRRLGTLHAWAPHPGLTPQLRQVFTMRVLYGMSAPMVGNEIHLASSSVEKYMQTAYQVLASGWGDESTLLGVDLGRFSPEVQAFHRFNLPPVVNLSNSRLQNA